MSVSKDMTDFNIQGVIYGSSKKLHVVANVTRKYISRPNDVAVIYLLKSILKDLFNTEMWNCNEIERSFSISVISQTTNGTNLACKQCYSDCYSKRCEISKFQHRY
jgi:hypothetical protein